MTKQLKIEAEKLENSISEAVLIFIQNTEKGDNSSAVCAAAMAALNTQVALLAMAAIGRMVVNGNKEGAGRFLRTIIKGQEDIIREMLRDRGVDL